jgi:hypothetical protein
MINPSSLQTRHKGAVYSAYAAVRLLQTGLEEQGRRPTRNGLVASLNRLWKFDTGILPPLTYNENRRSGTRGSSIVAMDPASKGLYQVTEWEEMQ